MLQTIETIFFIIVMYGILCVAGMMILDAIEDRRISKTETVAVQEVQQSQLYIADEIFAEIMEYRKEQQLRSGNTAEFKAKIQFLK